MQSKPLSLSNLCNEGSRSPGGSSLIDIFIPKSSATRCFAFSKNDIGRAFEARAKSRLHGTPSGSARAVARDTAPAQADAPVVFPEQLLGRTRGVKVAATRTRRAHRNRIPGSRIGLCSIGQRRFCGARHVQTGISIERSLDREREHCSRGRRRRCGRRRGSRWRSARVERPRRKLIR
jgi:hypothetical protein